MTTKEAVALLERYSNYDGMGIPNLAGCKEAMRVAVDALKGAFSELKEREDERIRKWLYDFIHNCPNENFEFYGGVGKQAVLAYLEKQKDSVSNAKYIEDVAHAFEDGRKKGIEEQQKPAESISQLTVQGKGVYKICPRCKERMIRDDSMVYTSMPPQYIYECPKCGERECDTVMYDSPVDEKQKVQESLKVGETAYFDPNTDMWFIKKEQKPILSDRDLTDFEIEVHEIIAQARNDSRLNDADVLKQFEEEAAFALMLKANKLIEQKPAEWSEEDEKIYDDIISALEKSLNANRCYFTSDDVKFLKLLRPQPHWKPSEEQMKALEDAFRKDGSDEYRKTINSLHQDLKKLM